LPYKYLNKKQKQSKQDTFVKIIPYVKVIKDKITKFKQLVTKSIPNIKTIKCKYKNK
jgi:hypothetical protein